jgi:membrane fusion protein (multidrug efflux system)
VEREAALANLQAQYTLQQSVLHQAQADLSAASASAVFASEDASRYQSLAATQAGSRQDAQRAFTGVQKAEAAVAAADARLAAARDEFAVLDAQIVGAKARISQARADLDTARLNLGYTDIVSPVAGYIGDRYAEVGAYVAVGTDLLSIVPASGLWVDANFKEDQLSRPSSRMSCRGKSSPAMSSASPLRQGPSSVSFHRRTRPETSPRPFSACRFASSLTGMPVVSGY